MSDLVLVADMKRSIKDTFGDLIVSFDLKIPQYEEAENRYDQSRQDVKTQLQRLYAGLEKLNTADTPEKRQKIKDRMMSIAKEDVSESFAAYIETFLNLIETYGEND